MDELDTDLIELSESELDDAYCEMLDECYPDCSIAGYNYCTSLALYEVDPIAYDCGFSDWLDSEITEGRIIEHNDKYYKGSNW